MTAMKYLIGILIAQIAVPLGFIITGILNGMISGHNEDIAFLSAATVLVTSLFGLIISTPLSILIGIPLSFMLAKYGLLKLPYILVTSILVPILGLLIFFGGFNLNTLVLVAIPTFLGATIYWFFLMKIGALTNKAS